jgi:hypothetical protein
MTRSATYPQDGPNDACAAGIRLLQAPASASILPPSRRTCRVLLPRCGAFQFHLMFRKHVSSLTIGGLPELFGPRTIFFPPDS